MAIKKEIWARYIVSNLFKNAEFMNFARNEDEYVLNGALVHIPQAGAKPNVQKNRGTLPATIIKRTDTDIVYLLNEFTSDPTLISDAEKYEESPEKLSSVLDEHVQTLRENCGDELLHDWLAAFATSGAGSPASDIAAATVLRTSGVNTGAYLPSSTGTRKKFVKDDLRFAQTLMNKQNIVREDRYALFSSELLGQLMDDVDLIKRDVSAELDLKNGVIAKLYGFNVLERSSTAVYNNAGTPAVKAVGAAGAATDNDSIVCWQKNSVARAMGTAKVFEELGKPEYYGDVYSALLRLGGRKTRKSAEGVVAIVQAVGV